jgi:hypothetical protein
VADVCFDSAGRHAWFTFFQNYGLHIGSLTKTKPVALPQKVRPGFAVKIAGGLAYPLLPPAHGVSVALQ